MFTALFYCFVQDQSELALKQAFKPHNGAVTCICLDGKAETLATGSSDKTVFFFSVGDTYTPIGFIKTPSEVTSLTWTPESYVSSQHASAKVYPMCQY